jgi:hypothetical protein
MKLDWSRIQLIFLGALPFVIGSVISASILTNPLFSEAILSGTRTYTPLELIIQALISMGLGSTIVFSLFYALERRGSFARRVFVAMVVSPILTLVFFVLGQALLLIMFLGATNTLLPSLLSFGSLAVFMLSIVFIVMDSVPPMLKNLFVLFYGSIFGTFLGVSFVTSSMLVLIVTLALEDWMLTRFSPATEAAKMSDQIGSDPFDYTRIQTQSVAVGAGDFIAFALISAHAYLYFPFYVWAMSTALAMLGVIINSTILAKELEPMPNIPLPALLAIIPWIVHIVALIPFT